jgi:hypothetical protein
MRDDFPLPVKEVLSKRVGNRCSNPGCRQSTSGPQEDPTKVINVGVAAHITGASVDGPRYDPNLTADERKSAANGIWLCQVCGKLVDNDEVRYTVSILRRWKTISESAALRALELRNQSDPEVLFLRLEQLMPELLDQMRQDLRQVPLRREFVLLKKSWTYLGRGHELEYYYDDHQELEGMMRILQNYGLIREITFNEVKRYVMAESLARYLGA